MKLVVEIAIDNAGPGSRRWCEEAALQLRVIADRVEIGRRPESTLVDREGKPIGSTRVEVEP